jgi:hypothetical protein
MHFLFPGCVALYASHYSRCVFPWLCAERDGPINVFSADQYRQDTNIFLRRLFIMCLHNLMSGCAPPRPDRRSLSIMRLLVDGGSSPDGPKNETSKR